MASLELWLCIICFLVATYFCISEMPEGGANPVHDRVVHVRLQSNFALVVGAAHVGHVSL